MKTVNMKPFTIEGSVSSDQCELLRNNVEGLALEQAGEVVHEVRDPGLKLYQLNSRHLLATYLLIDGKAAVWSEHECKWLPLLVPADHIEKSQLMEKIH